MTPLRQADRYLEIGFAFPAGIVVGLMIGYGLDRHFHTHFLYVVGLLLGIAAGFVTLVRLTMKPKPTKDPSDVP
jgi:ATP synthase protein I